MHQPPGFVDQTKPNHVCLLRKSLYGLKQAPRAWYHRFSTYAKKICFTQRKCDQSLFVYSHNNELAYLLLYVDDIILKASSTRLLHSIITSLSHEFEMTDLGQLHFFLGIAVTRNSSGLFLHQRQYATEILARASMSNCTSCLTPVDTNPKLPTDAGPPVSDPTLYRSLAGALQYLTFTRPDIAYAVQQVCLHMHDPRKAYFNALKRILRYLKGTLTHGLQLYRSSVNRLVAYSDTDWADCSDTRRSTSGYCVFLGDNLISWSAKRQQTASRSSAEAEYRGVANVVVETSWLRNLLLELHQRTKHIEIDIHFVREHVALGQVRVLHVPSAYQYADIFTKGLPSPLFLDFRSSLSVRLPPALTAGEC
ncbi:PREDICTED: uncharacterized protein LOC109128708 [Camelina sativa]|uniref:Uncharacterized protein LOC109128708 n=1 Tax=Camelina sativa TaxID=90675 RepID=A0ABM1QWG1_CAMSA|nr:PREDICTED: uncharacterized protein LOC109128708 [Camelina sativa]